MLKTILFASIILKWAWLKELQYAWNCKFVCLFVCAVTWLRAKQQQWQSNKGEQNTSSQSQTRFDHLLMDQVKSKSLACCKPLVTVSTSNPFNVGDKCSFVLISHYYTRFLTSDDNLIRTNQHPFDRPSLLSFKICLIDNSFGSTLLLSVSRELMRRLKLNFESCHKGFPCKK